MFNPRLTIGVLSLTRVLGLAGVLGMVGHPIPAGAVPTLTLERCLLHDANNTRSVAARCGRLRVPENDERPDGEHIELFVAVIASRSKAATLDPFVPIAGGPGGASTEDYVAWGFAAFDAIRKNRDIVLVDQRGTGRSNRLTCPTLPEELATANAAQLESAARACVAQLPGDPRYYTTTVAVRDLERVRKALGYEQFNLYGVSYGSRVALEYMRAHGPRVRTAVLDGVVPSDYALGLRIPAAAQQAIDRTFARCKADDACDKRFPKLADDFDRLRRRLAETPVPVTYRHPRLGTPASMTLSDQHLAAVVRLLSYSAETAALIPLVIDQAANNDDFAPLAAQFSLVTSDLASQMANGMNAAVLCTEDVPFFQDANIDDEALAKTYLGRRMVDDLRAACGPWPRGTMTDDFKTPVRSDVPVLLLSGEADPVTPPSNAAHVQQTLSSSRHVVVEGHGHGVARLECVRQMINAFVETASVGAARDDCLFKEQPAPFFLSPVGPAP